MSPFLSRLILARRQNVAVDVPEQAVAGIIVAVPEAIRIVRAAVAIPELVAYAAEAVVTAAARLVGLPGPGNHPDTFVRPHTFVRLIIFVFGSPGLLRTINHFSIP